MPKQSGKPMTKVACPACGAGMRVLDSRTRYARLRVRRYGCPSCGFKENSIEIPVHVLASTIGQRAREEDLISCGAQAMSSHFLRVASRSALMRELDSRLKDDEPFFPSEK
jgi:predicted RNA-binding Zn-ribbon protein involved in translation (DUF1610 family)